MTIYLSEEAVSHLKDGIETILIPVRNGHDMEDLVFHSKRGGTYDVVEWLLAQLGRSTEIDRVCGLTVTPMPSVVAVTMEMRQPGKQLEEWLRQVPQTELDNSLSTVAYITERIYKALIREDEMFCPVLCKRALSQEKFTGKHRPWWEKEMYACPFCGSTDIEYQGERSRDKLHCRNCEADFGAGKRLLNGLPPAEVTAARDSQ